jgi:hypothetical protein
MVSSVAGYLLLEAQFGTYDLNENGLFFQRALASPDEEPTQLLPPFRVLATVLSAEGGGYALQIEQDTPIGHRTFLMPYRELDNARQVIARLADRGLRAGKNGLVFTDADGQKFQRHALISQFFSGLRPRTHRVTVLSAGWHLTREGYAFCLPNGRVFGAQSVLYGEPVPGLRWSASGTLAEWQREVVGRCRGNSRLVFALCVAFGGPVIQITGNADNGGFNLHGDSSTGKTTTLLVAGSPYGLGSASGGQVRGFNGTPLGLQRAAAECSGTILLLDELKHDLNPSELASGLYNICNVDDRTTAHTREAATWATFMLTTAENTVRARLGRFAQPGLEPRLTDLAAEVTPGTVFECIHGAASHAEFAQTLRAVSGTYYGTGGPAWLEYLAARRNSDDGLLRADLIRRANAFVEANMPKGADNIVERVFARAGMLAAAGELGIEAGILDPLQPGEAMAAVAQMMREWLRDRGKGGVDYSGAAERVRGYINRYPDRFPSMTDDKVPPNHTGWTEYDKDGRVKFYHINAAMLPQVIGNDLNLRTTARRLNELGVMQEGDEHGRLGRKLPATPANYSKANRTDRPRVYTIIASRLNRVGVEDI